MPWVTGEALNDWVARRRRDAPALRQVRDEMRSLVATLESSGVAHGDLQHGNVLVTEHGELKLLDYDGMYLPEFAGWAMPELGHPNFQHPMRASATYGPGLDRFSAIVIWIALAALEADPGLWERHDNGDNLLFRAADLADPEGSALFEELQRLPATQGLATSLVHIIQSEPDHVPSLDEVLAGGVVPVTSPVPRRVGPVAPYPIVDLRHGSISPRMGSRVTAVGEIIDTKDGVTRYGDPYRFVRVGSRTGSTLKVVLWSEVLARAKPDLPSVGAVVAVTGVMSTFAGQRQIELERPANLEVLESRRVRELLGSAWKEDPPAERLLDDLRVGDVVEHSVHGQGVVTAFSAGVATIRFSHSERKIHASSFPLRLISRATQQAARASGTTHATASTGASRPAAGVVSATDASVLARLFGGPKPVEPTYRPSSGGPADGDPPE